MIPNREFKLSELSLMNSSASEIDTFIKQYPKNEIVDISYVGWTKLAGGGDSSLIASPLDDFSIRLKTNNITSGYVVARKTINPLMLADTDTISVELYVHNSNNTRNIRITFLTDTPTVGTAYIVGYQTWTDGLNIMTFKVSDMIFTGTATATTLFNSVGIDVSNSTFAQSCYVDVGRFIIGGKAKVPMLVINFDSGYNKVYDWAYQIMKKYNLKGNVYAMPSAVGLGDRMSLAKYQELYNDGWDIGLYGNVDNMGANNHTKNGICTAQTISAGANFSIDGIYATVLDTPRIVTIYIASGNESTNSFLVTGLDKNGLAYSETLQGPTSVSGKAFSKNRFSKVTSIVAQNTCSVPVSFGTAFTSEEYKTQFTLQKAWLDANNFTRGWAHWAYPLGEFNGESEQWLRDLGFKTGRTVTTGTTLFRNQSRALVGNPYFSSCSVTLGDSGSHSTIVAHITKAQAVGCDLFLLGHLGGAVSPDLATLGQTLAYIASEVRANRLRVVSFSEYEKELGL